jgi:hypothetical protein
VTKGTAVLGGWRLLALLGMRAHANAHPKANPFARSVTPSPDMQYIDLCEADNMPVNNMALELLLQKHDQLANTERICEK